MQNSLLVLGVLEYFVNGISKSCSSQSIWFHHTVFFTASPQFISCMSATPTVLVLSGLVSHERKQAAHSTTWMTVDLVVLQCNAIRDDDQAAQARPADDRHRCSTRHQQGWPTNSTRTFGARCAPYHFKNQIQH